MEFGFVDLSHEYFTLVESHESIINNLILGNESFLIDLRDSYLESCSELNRFINSRRFNSFYTLIAGSNSKFDEIQIKVLSRTLYHVNLINDWLKLNEEMLVSLGERDPRIQDIIIHMTLTRVLCKTILEEFRKYDYRIMVPKDYYFGIFENKANNEKGHPFINDNVLNLFLYLKEHSARKDKIRYSYIFHFLVNEKIDIGLSGADYFRFVRGLDSTCIDRKPQPNATNHRRFEKLKELRKQFDTKEG
jgi:predicted nucleic-acid-binding protein